MRKKFSHLFPNILQCILPILFFFLLFFKGSSCEGPNFNKAMRTQVKQFLEASLKDIHKYNNDYALLHLFNGLSLYDDHFRFGGIFDYCIEKGYIAADQPYNPIIFHYNVNMEMLTYASDYINCVDSIYEATIKVNLEAYNMTGFTK
ncbi:unnamed protein product [Meloidogyne enterolobii]|uniref:Uncharacterized protein n=1 Tax=Meloidogyne enterolobii TaxID=390850 RepID=A0ACB0XK95_MELEN